MNRTLKAMNKGRFRIWWLTHGRRAKVSMQLVCVAGAFLFTSAMDHRDQLASEQAAHEGVKRVLTEERNARDLPPVVWIVESATIEEAQVKLARVAGELDMQRAKLKEYAK